MSSFSSPPPKRRRTTQSASPASIPATPATPLLSPPSLPIPRNTPPTEIIPKPPQTYQQYLQEQSDLLYRERLAKWEEECKTMFDPLPNNQKKLPQHQELRERCESIRGQLGIVAQSRRNFQGARPVKLVFPQRMQQQMNEHRTNQLPTNNLLQGGKRKARKTRKIRKTRKTRSIRQIRK